ncbi:MAG: metal ABC transporter substrate-binding protein [Verrucomicrobiota bacterium]
MFRILIACLATGLLPFSLWARVEVVAANAIIADWVEQIGGDQVAITTLVEAGEDPHHFEPSPRMIRKLAKADIIIEFGQGMEPWLEDLIAASDTSAQIITLTYGLDLMATGDPYWSEIPELHQDAENKPPCCSGDAIEENKVWAIMIATLEIEHAVECEDHEHGYADHHAHEHGEYDPHVWLDPQMALMMVLTIDGALADADPDSAATFSKRREAYLEELIDLDEWAAAQLATIPVEHRFLINYHDNLRYFGRRYGFITPKSVLGTNTTEASDPSAKEFATLVKWIQKHQVPALFVDATANEKLTRQISREAGLPDPYRLYTGNLSPDAEASDYLSMMRTNVNTLTEALAQPRP